MKITQDHDKCIGCGSCVALCQKYWEMGDNGKAHLKGGTKNESTGTIELEVEKIGCNQDAVDGCPVEIIKIIK